MSTELVPLPNVPTRAAIDALQACLLAMPQSDIRTTHRFPPGKYERRIDIPPWTVLTGATHKTDYWVRVESGTIAVTTDNGVRVCEAPCEFQAKAGIQRAGRVFSEPVIWVDVYDNPDDCRDVAVLEARLYEVPDCGLGENRTKIARDRNDYQRFLGQIGLTQPQMDAIVHSDDVIEVEGFHVELRPSSIHGHGLFALRDFAPGEMICPGRLNGHRTQAGRFINHSPDPNVMPEKRGDDIYAVALKHIPVDTELTVDYRDSMRVNFGVMQCLAGPLAQ